VQAVTRRTLRRPPRCRQPADADNLIIQMLPNDESLEFGHVHRGRRVSPAGVASLVAHASHSGVAMLLSYLVNHQNGYGPRERKYFKADSPDCSESRRVMVDCLHHSAVSSTCKLVQTARVPNLIRENERPIANHLRLALCLGSDRPRNFTEPAYQFRPTLQNPTNARGPGAAVAADLLRMNPKIHKIPAGALSR